MVTVIITASALAIIGYIAYSNLKLKGKLTDQTVKHASTLSYVKELETKTGKTKSAKKPAAKQKAVVDHTPKSLGSEPKKRGRKPKEA